jgi:hypothetical protein
MQLGHSEKPKNQDFDTLFYIIDISIRDVLNENNIAEIDKQSRTKLINAVTMDIQILKGNYDNERIKRIISNSLWQIEHSETPRFKNSPRDYRWQI